MRAPAFFLGFPALGSHYFQLAQLASREADAIAGVDKSQSPLVDDLTAREVEVLRLIAEGLGNKEIAHRLSISEKTVKNHINNIFSKLHLYDRTQATLYAIRTGLAKV
ncbi:MAG: response regulator transcription factor [Chloroflexota bacterium]